MKSRVVLSSPIMRSSRVAQVEGLFDVPPSERSETTVEFDLPIDDMGWHIGLIVGPSGSGKSTIARQMFSEYLLTPWKWPRDRSVLDAFPASLSIQEITELLSSVGFSSPPNWLRPFHTLSTGEQFRVSVAHALAERREITAIDEFTSVVDRTVARVGSAAVARTVRHRNQKLIAFTCHYDVIEWLDPDWVFDTGSRRFERRRLRGRPPVPVKVFRVDANAWRVFRHAHYLSADLNRAAYCFCGFIDDKPAVFLAMLSFPHASRPGWRIHRLVCLPDFQGIGLGTRFSNYIASVFRATGRPVFLTNSHPALIRYCSKSPLWRMTRAPSLRSPRGKTSTVESTAAAVFRYTAGFEYVGPARPELARSFGIMREEGS